jgi:hypothetical protein
MLLGISNTVASLPGVLANLLTGWMLARCVIISFNL